MVKRLPEKGDCKRLTKHAQIQIPKGEEPTHPHTFFLTDNLTADEISLSWSATTRRNDGSGRSDTQRRNTGNRWASTHREFQRQVNTANALLLGGRPLGVGTWFRRVGGKTLFKQHNRDMKKLLGTSNGAVANGGGERAAHAMRLALSNCTQYV